jgi:hypothetical protein
VRLLLGRTKGLAERAEQRAVIYQKRKSTHAINCLVVA